MLADDISYIPSVIFVSYFGSKGNRAKYIGGGALIIAGAQLLISTPNFVFRAHKPEINLIEVGDQLRPDSSLLNSNTALDHYFNYPLIRDRIPLDVRQKVFDKLYGHFGFDKPFEIEYAAYNESSYQLDETLMSKVC